MDKIDLVWTAPPGCYQCVQMPRLCVWPIRRIDADGIDKYLGPPVNRDPPVRITFEGFDLADEQVIRWSEVPDYIKWCREWAVRPKGE